MNAVVPGSGTALKAACETAIGGADFYTYDGHFYAKKTGPTSFDVTTDTGNNFTYDDGANFVLNMGNGTNAAGLTNAPTGTGKSVFFLLDTGNDKVQIDGGLGTAGNPVVTSVLSNANIELVGSSKLKPALKITTVELPPWDKIQITALSGEDLIMSGSAAADDLIEGVLYSHEQFSMTGSGNMSGQVIGYEKALDYPSRGTVTTNSATTSSYAGTPIDAGQSSVTGNFEITHSAGAGYLGSFTQVSWRQLHDFDPLTKARP
jgi:hypothetical protein